MQILPWGPLSEPWIWRILKQCIAWYWFKPHIARRLHKYMYLKEYYTNQPIRLLDGIGYVRSQQEYWRAIGRCI